jgi:hypothetical protein
LDETDVENNQIVGVKLSDERRRVEKAAFVVVSRMSVVEARCNTVDEVPAGWAP